MNFFRGTGLRGLIGMDAEYLKIFRPLLPFRKYEILEYARENNLQFVEDSSNA
jgi:tRNA(Ile)-lysidine synthase